MPDPPCWCLLRIACQGLERSLARVDARRRRPTRTEGSWDSWYRPGLYGGGQVEGTVIDRGPSMDPRHCVDIH
jgi:hypothetical protein